MKSLLFFRYPQIWLIALGVWLLPMLTLLLTSLIYGSSDIVLSSFDWAILGCCFVGGIFLTFQRRLFWGLSLATLFVTAILNLYQASVLAAHMMAFDYQFLLAVALLVAICVISYHFRFPYLDGRDSGLFGIAHRFQSSWPATLEGKPGMVTSISITGALFQADQSIGEVTVGSDLKLSIPEVGFEEISSEVRGLQGDKIRLKFNRLSFAQFRRLKRKFKSLILEPRKD